MPRKSRRRKPRFEGLEPRYHAGFVDFERERRELQDRRYNRAIRKVFFGVLLPVAGIIAIVWLFSQYGGF